jgi:predicted RNase H-like HicB family nuclease
MVGDLRILLIRDGDIFVAQCLELDVAAQGSSKDEALSRLNAVMRIEIKEARDQGRDIKDIGPAPTVFHEIYESEIVGRQVLKFA